MAHQKTNRIVTILTTAALIASHPFCLARAAQPYSPQVIAGQATPQTLDVKLGAQNQLLGRVVDSQGQPVSGINVRLISANGSVLETAAAQQGQFAFHSVRGGEYMLHVNGSSKLMRVWSEGTAPPAALPTVDVVVGPTVRGNFGGGLNHKQLLMLGLFAGGLAVGVSQIDSSTGS